MSKERAEQLLLQIASDPDLVNQLSNADPTGRRQIVNGLGFSDVTDQDVIDASSGLQKVQQVAQSQGLDLNAWLTHIETIVAGWAH